MEKVSLRRVTTAAWAGLEDALDVALWAALWIGVPLMGIYLLFRLVQAVVGLGRAVLGALGIGM